MNIRSYTDSNDKCPVPISVGQLIRFDIIGASYSNKNFDRPDEFNPNRFLDQDGAISNTEALMTFATGPRGCIGRSFAVVEAAAVLAKIVLRYKISFAAEVDWKLRGGESEGDRVRRLYNVRAFSNEMIIQF